MTTKIDSKIIGYAVAQNPASPTPTPTPMAMMHEKIKRPQVLAGSTYRIKSPLSECSIYITINDILLDGKRHPFEIFINSRSMEHFQWVTALTRLISAVFRKGGEVRFLVDELKYIFDPKGGYFKPGGKYMPSLIAEIGSIIDEHLRFINYDPKSNEADVPNSVTYPSDPNSVTYPSYPRGATLCDKCHTVALVRQDNCATCLACGYSKCG